MYGGIYLQSLVNLFHGNGTVNHCEPIDYIDRHTTPACICFEAGMCVEACAPMATAPEAMPFSLSAKQRRNIYSARLGVAKRGPRLVFWDRGVTDDVHSVHMQNTWR